MPKRISLQILTVLLAVLSAPLAFAADVPLGQTVASLLDYARQNNPDYATGRIMRQYRTPWEAVS